jgi:hypothetical protein
MLLGRTGRPDEELIAAGAVARAIRSIFGNGRWALALGRCRTAANGRGLLLALPIAPTLRLPTPFAVRAGAITLGRPPAAPAPRRLLTGRAAIARLGTARTEPALTALEQTAAAAERLTAGLAKESLTATAVAGKVKRAHGR